MRTRLFPIILKIYLTYYLFINCGGDLAQWCGGNPATSRRGIRTQEVSGSIPVLPCVYVVTYT